MTKITSLAIGTHAIILKFLTSFNLRFIMRMWTILSLFTFAMYKFFTYSICCKLRMITCCSRLCRNLCIIASLSIHLMISIHHVVILLIGYSIEIRICDYLMLFVYVYIYNRSGI